MTEDSRDGPPTDSVENTDLLGHEVRVKILMTLAVHPSRQSGDAPNIVRMSYSALMDQVDVRDSGRFNYHLSKLRDTLVKKEEDEYMLTPAGLEAVAGITGVKSGEDGRRDLGPAPFDCPICGAEATGEHELGLVSVACTEYENHSFSTLVTSGSTVDRPSAEIWELARISARQENELARKNVCPSCKGRFGQMSRQSGNTTDRPHVFRGECSQCGYVHVAAPRAIAATHPAVVSFFFERGINIHEKFVWTVGNTPENDAADLQDRGEVEVTFEQGEDSITAVLDETGSVVEVRDET